MAKLVRAIGLMSGTSMDGIDVAVLATDGEARIERGPSVTIPYTGDQMRRLAQGLRDAEVMAGRDERPGSLAALEADLTRWHVDGIAALRQAHPARSEADVIGFHGQTVLHRPKDRLTVQLGDGALLASLTRLPVVNDFRAADVSAGGEGAPLVPVYHKALAATVSSRPVAFLNVGGVANVTWIGGDGDPIAFDTGPGNGLVNDWMSSHTGEVADIDGRHALMGKVHESVLARLMDHPYFAAPAPKSLDRKSFSGEPATGLSLEDGAATLTRFTARAVRAAVPHLPEAPRVWIVCGGGRHNPALMAALGEELKSEVSPAEAFGFDGDAIEAEAFAYLAVRSRRGLPITFPLTTGVPRPMTGGVLHTA